MSANRELFKSVGQRAGGLGEGHAPPEPPLVQKLVAKASVASAASSSLGPYRVLEKKTQPFTSAYITRGYARLGARGPGEGG